MPYRLNIQQSVDYINLLIYNEYSDVHNVLIQDDNLLFPNNVEGSVYTNDLRGAKRFNLKDLITRSIITESHVDFIEGRYLLVTADRDTNIPYALSRMIHFEDIQTEDIQSEVDLRLSDYNVATLQSLSLVEFSELLLDIIANIAYFPHASLYELRDQRSCTHRSIDYNRFR